MQCRSCPYRTALWVAHNGVLRDLVPLEFVAALPSLIVHESREAGRFVLLPPADPRYAEITARDSGVAAYLRKFQTPFGVKLSPPVICFDRLARQADGRSLSRFRDCIAVAAIVEARRKTLVSGRITGFIQSDSFDFYPVHPGRDRTHVYLRTASEEGLHELSALRGQCSPAVLHPQHQLAEFDDVLLTPLLKVFAGRRVAGGLRTRIFRSLHAAYAACRAPFHQLGSALDLGMTTSMWVTAFEVLVHPGGHEDVRFKHVSEAIRRIPWPDSELRRNSRVQMRNSRGKRPEGLTTIPLQLYGRLYATRCAFLHGEPDLSAAKTHLNDGRRGRLAEQVAVLYRFTLLRVLADAGLYEFPTVPDWRNPMSETQKEGFRTQFGRWWDESVLGGALRPQRKAKQ